MACFKCKMCGGDLNVTGSEKVVECEYCGSRQTVPSADDEKKVNLFNRANRLRIACDFDRAAAIYEQIIADFPEEAEAYWGLCLSNYGIEYVDDPATGKKIPTCHRASFDKMRKDENYASALENADMASRLVYEEQAKEIDRIMGEILSVSRDEEPYDIFICYKETDNNGSRTPDSVLAQDIYDALVGKGYRVFFSRITLEDKLGAQYEPYIFSALNSAKIMLAVGTDFEYFNAVWVKNEWSRFLKLVAKDKAKVLIPCYQNMDPYDMPDEFKGLQSQDCSKLGFMQDLTRGIDKILSVKNSKSEKSNTDALLERAFLALEDGEWEQANRFCEQVLNQDPKNAKAYLGKLLVEFKVNNLEKLKDCESNFEESNNYAKVLRFGNEELFEELRAYLGKIQSQSRMEESWNKTDKKRFASLGKIIAIFAVLAAIIAALLLVVKVITPNRKYDEAIQVYESGNYEDAVIKFEELKDYKESAFYIKKSRENITEEENNSRYNEAMSLFASGDYESAKAIFIELGEYQDCNAQIKNCDSAIIDREYENAMSLYSEGNYEGAIAAFKLLDGYLDSFEMIDECVRQIEQNEKLSDFEKVKTGDIYQFGEYEQNDNMSDGKEAIEWIVLEKEGGKALLLSCNILDCRTFHSTMSDVTWQNSSLRRWLNDSFLKNAFSPEEREYILSENIKAERNPRYSTSPGNNTDDKVFLLSLSEAEYYFSSDDSRKCAPTDYAIYQGAGTKSTNTVEGRLTSCWWLRTPGSQQYSTVAVNYDGSIYYPGDAVNCYDDGVRPAIWIDFGA